jgi:hypothetical protein
MIWIRRMTFVGALIALSAVHSSLNAPMYGQEDRDGKNNPLKLTVTLLAQHYCANREIWDSPVRGSVVGTAAFDFHLRIQNVSDHAIILCRKCVKSDWPVLWDINADGTRGALRREPMIMDTYGPTTARVHHPKRPDSDYPIIPRDGELEIDRSIDVDLVIFSTAHPPAKVWLYPGRYFIQPRFVTWEDPDPGAKNLGRRWKSYGDLYDDELVAEPMPIEIETQHDMPDCRTR